jgi:hypothetical protein
MVASRAHLPAIASALAITALLSLMVVTTVVARSPAVVHHVTAGGPDACIALDARPGCDGNYSLVASEYADGAATGEYIDLFANGNGIKGVIDCVRVVGNEAWISGWITSGRLGDNDFTGLPFVTRVRDNGKSAQEPPDQISSSHTGDPTPCTDMASYDLLDTPQGQVVVK